MSIAWEQVIKGWVTPLNGVGWRAVGDQKDGPATQTLVDSLEELDILEQCLDAVKPKVPDGISAKYKHGYLLTTPFRYPPLKYGSRFGGRHEMGIFYCAKEKTTALCEGAYYGLVFYDGMEEPPPTKRITQSITVFSFEYSALKGLNLHSKPFLDYQDTFTDPSNYKETQRLGSSMRELNIDGFEYTSARTINGGINLGFLNSSVFTSDLKTENWVKEITHEKVTYYSLGRENPHPRLNVFQRSDFIIDGVLPKPAL